MMQCVYRRQCCDVLIQCVYRRRHRCDVLMQYVYWVAFNIVAASLAAK
jgi:hypothetical protein